MRIRIQINIRIFYMVGVVLIINCGWFLMGREDHLLHSDLLVSILEAQALPPHLLFGANSFIQKQNITTATNYNQSSFRPIIDITAKNTNKNNTRQRQLPIRNETGLIIFFLHLPKTAGSTVSGPFLKTKYLQNNFQHSYAMKVYGKTNYKKYRDQLTRILNNWKPGTVIYFEYHAGNAPPYIEYNVQREVRQWRQQARELGIPWFAFSVLREPLSMAISQFNYYHVGSRAYPGYKHFRHARPSEQDFINLTLPSPQCLFLAQTEMAYKNNDEGHRLLQNFTERDCQKAYQILLKDMDWIGTTDTLAEQTLPLLRRVLKDNDTNISGTSNISTTNKTLLIFPNRNTAKGQVSDHSKIIKRQDLTDLTIQHVRNQTKWDQELYDHIQYNYVIDMFR